MGMFDFLKPKDKKVHMNAATALSGVTPLFSQFGEDIYASDVVQQAITCIVSEMKKLTPKHIREIDGMVQEVKGSINNILSIPNDLMICSDFIEKIVWKLYMDYNVFIYPTYVIYKDAKGQVQKKYTGLYPLNPINVDFLEDASGTLFTKFRFQNNYEVTLPYSELIHIRKNFSINDYMGGDNNGQPNNGALLKTLEINNSLLEGIQKGIESSYSVNGVVQYKSLIDEKTTAKEVAKFEEHLQNNKSGLLLLGVNANYTPIGKDIKMVDKDTLEFIDSKILRNYGVSLPILSGDYSKAQYEAFYQSCLEPLIIQLGQAFTKTLFTPNERSFGNKVVFYPEELIFLNNDQKLELVKELGGRGGLSNNEIRKIFGLPPKEGEDRTLQSLNYVDVSIANQYQLNNKKEVQNDEGKQGS